MRGCWPRHLASANPVYFVCVVRAMDLDAALDTFYVSRLDSILDASFMANSWDAEPRMVRGGESWIASLRLLATPAEIAKIAGAHAHAVEERSEHGAASRSDGSVADSLRESASRVFVLFWFGASFSRFEENARHRETERERGTLCVSS